jgi:hypothetical protein
MPVGRLVVVIASGSVRGVIGALAMTTAGLSHVICPTVVPASVTWSSVVDETAVSLVAAPMVTVPDDAAVNVVGEAVPGAVIGSPVFGIVAVGVNGTVTVAWNLSVIELGVAPATVPDIVTVTPSWSPAATAASAFFTAMCMSNVLTVTVVPPSTGFGLIVPPIVVVASVRCVTAGTFVHAIVNGALVVLTGAEAAALEETRPAPTTPTSPIQPMTSEAAAMFATRRDSRPRMVTHPFR